MKDKLPYFYLRKWMYSGIFIVIQQSLIISLDVKIVYSLDNALSFGINGFEEHNWSLVILGIYISFVLIIGIALQIINQSCNGQCSKTLFLFFSWFQAISIIFREILLNRLYSCFKLTNNDLIISRVIFHLATIAIYVILITEVYFRFKQFGFWRLMNVASICLLIMYLNLRLIHNLNTELEHEIDPKNIDVGFFTDTELAQIENGDFKKDKLFNFRLIGKLSEILESEQEIYPVCPYAKKSKPQRILAANVTCTNDTKYLFEDCNEASSIVFKFIYKSTESPRYNCGLRYNHLFMFGCPHFSRLNYTAALIQQINGNVELAWKGICTCGKKQPNVKLIRDDTINVF